MATTTTTKTTIAALAAEVCGAFEGRVRSSGAEFRTLRDGSPRWMADLCHEAHGEMMPDDWRYALIERAAKALAEAEDPDEATVAPSDYIGELTSWLGSRGDRYAYCDDVMNEWGGEFPGTFELMQMGQAAEMDEVLGLVRLFLGRMAEAGEAVAGDDDRDEYGDL